MACSDRTEYHARRRRFWRAEHRSESVHQGLGQGTEPSMSEQDTAEMDGEAEWSGELWAAFDPFW